MSNKKGCWNYRIRKRSIQDFGETVEWYDIVEAFYDSHKDADKFKHTTYTVDSMEPHGSTLAELEADIAYMLKAFKKPIIEEN